MKAAVVNLIIRVTAIAGILLVAGYLLNWLAGG